LLSDETAVDSSDYLDLSFHTMFVEGAGAQEALPLPCFFVTGERVTSLEKQTEEF
jgi:hypothetical protein